MVKVLAAQNMGPWPPSMYASVTEQLPVAFRDKAGKFLRWQDAQAFLIGRLLLKEGLKKFGIREHNIEDIQYTRFNRPFISDREFDFNISHSGQYIVCAISRTGRIGVDIEQIHDVNIQDFASCFTSGELDRLTHSEKFLHEFFNIWTVKEAVIKADGRGLQIPLQEINASAQIQLEDTLWYIYPLEIANGYISHLAIDTIIKETIEIERVFIY